MAGGESGYNISDSGFNAQDIHDFMAQTGTDASALLGAKAYALKDGSKTFYGDKVGTLNPLVDKFNAWKQTQAQNAVLTSSYLQLKQDRPGRDATILTDPSKTILGMPKQPL